MKKIILKEPVDGAVVPLLPRYISEYLTGGKPIAAAGGSVDWSSPELEGVERAHPLPVTLRFRADGIDDPCRVLLSERPDFAGAMEKVTRLRSACFDNLKAGTEYYWKAESGSCSSPVFTFTTDSAAPRLIHADGVSNVRDLGAWPTRSGRAIRQGMIYRGGEMDVHQKITAAGKKVFLEDLGIRTDLDFRGEVADRIHISALGTGVNRVFIPCCAYREFLLREYGSALRAIFSVFADPAAYPIYMHCWGGADRTGTVAFLLEALLGVADENLMQDYELTTFSIWGARTRSVLQFRQFLLTLDRYGSAPGASYADKAEACLRDAGVTQDEISAIRALLLEES